MLLDFDYYLKLAVAANPYTLRHSINVCFDYFPKYCFLVKTLSWKENQAGSELVNLISENLQEIFCERLLGSYSNVEKVHSHKQCVWLHEGSVGRVRVYLMHINTRRT